MRSHDQPQHLPQLAVGLAGLLLVAGALSGCASASAPRTPRTSTPASTTPQHGAVPIPSGSPTPYVTPTSVAVAPTGLLIYDNASADVPFGQLTLRVYSPTTGEVTATHVYKGSILAVSGTIHADANRYVSSDLRLTLYLDRIADGTKQLFASSDDGVTTDVSSALAKSDSFSGGLSAAAPFFRGDYLYFRMGTGSDENVGTQYKVPIARIEAGDLTSSDYTQADEAIDADSLSDETNDCAQSGGKYYLDSSGVLSTGRYLHVDYDSAASSRLTTLRPGSSSCGDVDPNAGTPLTPASTKVVTQAVVSPDGSEVAFIALQGLTTELYTTSAAGGEPARIATLVSRNVSLAGWR